MNKNKIKHLLIGVVIGLMFSSNTTLANTKDFILKLAEFPILVDGEEYKNDQPILNYEGITYVPLRAMSDMFGKEIKWNNKEKRVEIGKIEQVNNENIIIETTFNDMRAIRVNDVIYYSKLDYDNNYIINNSSANFEYDKENNKLTYTVGDITQTILINDDNIVIYKGETYILSKYFIQ